MSDRPQAQEDSDKEYHDSSASTGYDVQTDTVGQTEVGQPQSGPELGQPSNTPEMGEPQDGPEMGDLQQNGGMPEAGDGSTYDEGGKGQPTNQQDDGRYRDSEGRWNDAPDAHARGTHEEGKVGSADTETDVGLIG